MQNRNIKLKTSEVLPRSMKIFVFFIAILIFDFFFLHSVTQASITIGKPLNFLTLNTGLVGYWTFDGPKMLTNVADSSSNANHGYLSGQISTTTAIGKFGQALLFDGSNDYVSTGNFNVGSSNFTISLWLKKPSGTGDFYFLNQQDGSGNHWYLEIYNNKIYWHTTASGWVSGTNSVNIDAWNHIVIVGNDANTLFYLNGALDKTGAKSSDISSANIPLFIGYNSNFGAYFNGSLDDVRIYNRVLSTTEIQQLYNLSSITKFSMTPRGIPSTGLESGLAGHWTFDGPKMLTNVADSSGSGNNGSLIGQTSTTTVAGKLGQALQLDGINDYVNFGNNSSLNITGPGSISVWIRVNSWKTNYDQIIWKKGPGWADIHYGIIRNSTASYFVGNLSNGTNYLGADGPRSSTITLGKWYHLAYTWDGAKAKMYTNGVETDSKDTTILPKNEAANVLISSYYPLDGSVDDVRIYNRALSPTEVMQLYKQGR